MARRWQQTNEQINGHNVITAFYLISSLLLLHQAQKVVTMNTSTRNPVTADKPTTTSAVRQYEKRQTGGCSCYKCQLRRYASFICFREQKHIFYLLIINDNVIHPVRQGDWYLLSRDTVNHCVFICHYLLSRSSSGYDLQCCFLSGQVISISHGHHLFLMILFKFLVSLKIFG